MRTDAVYRHWCAVVRWRMWVAGVAAWLLLLTGHAAWRDHQLLTVFSGMSLACGAANLIPFRQGAFLSDGMQLMALRSEVGAWRSDLSRMLHSLAALHRPREWDCNHVAQLVGLPEIDHLYFEYFRSLDVADVDGAHACLQRAITRVSPDSRGSRWRDGGVLALDIAAFEGAWRGDTVAGRAWLSHGARTRDSHAWSLATAAIAAASGNGRGARKALAAAERSALHDTVMRPDLLRMPIIERIESMIGR